MLVFCEADRLIQVTFLEERVEELEACIEKLLAGRITEEQAKRILGNKFPD